MIVKGIQEWCKVVGEQLGLEAEKEFRETGELYNEKRVVADMLDEIAEYQHEND